MGSPRDNVVEFTKYTQSTIKNYKIKYLVVYSNLRLADINDVDNLRIKRITLRLYKKIRIYWCQHFIKPKCCTI